MKKVGLTHPVVLEKGVLKFTAKREVLATKCPEKGGLKIWPPEEKGGLKYMINSEETEKGVLKFLDSAIKRMNSTLQEGDFSKIPCYSWVHAKDSPVCPERKETTSGERYC